MTPPSRNRLLRLSLAVVLLLVFWTTRLVGIDAFPMFTDEAFHIRFARNVVEKSLLSNGEEGRQLVIWLYALVQADMNAAIFTARTANLITLLPGLAALMASAALLAGTWASSLLGLLMILSTYHLFFERMALADPVSASALSVALYFTVRLVRRTSLWDALLAGLMLFVAYMAKVSALPFVAMPLAGVWFLSPQWRTRRQSVCWLLVALVPAVTLITLFTIVFAWRGHNPLFYLLRGTGSNMQGIIPLLLERIPTNIQSNVVNLSGFLTLPGLILLLAALAVLVWRHWFLPTIIAGAMAVFWLNNRPDTRHLIIPLNLALLGGAMVLAWFMQRYARRLQFVMVAVVMTLGLAHWFPFFITLNTQPAALALPANDYQQYLASEGSGSGLSQLADSLVAYQPQQVLGLFANCWALEYLVGDSLPVVCPHINPNGSSIDDLTALMESSRSVGTYVVLEHLDYLPTSAPGTLVASIERPPPGPRLDIYDLALTDDGG